MTNELTNALGKERLLMLMRSVAAYLKDDGNRVKRIEAVSDTMAYERLLQERNEPIPDREFAAYDFLERLAQQDVAAWSRLFVLILNRLETSTTRHDDIGRCEFKELKDASPFRGHALTLAGSNNVQPMRDMDDCIADALAHQSKPLEGQALLLCITIKVEAAYKVST